MRNFVFVLVAVLAFLCANSFGASVFSDSFSDPNGPLLGQNPQVGGPWTITGTSVVNPLSVSGGLVPLANTGQDAYAALSSPVTLSDGQSIYFGMDINVSAALTGDYFFHFTPDAGDASLFYGRLFVQSIVGGYVLGWEGTAGGGATINYGTAVLSLNTTYDLVVAYNYSSTTPTNASGAIYVNPLDPNVANNTPYLTSPWNSTNPDTNTIAAVNLRQGTASSAPTLTVDNLAVSRTFGDLVPTPEPTTLALVFGGAACLVALRRRR